MESGSFAARFGGAHWRLWALVPIAALVGAVALAPGGVRGEQPVAVHHGAQPQRRLVPEPGVQGGRRLQHPPVVGDHQDRLEQPVDLCAAVRDLDDPVLYLG